jgi:thiamine-monophosphate kinase
LKLSEIGEFGLIELLGRDLNWGPDNVEMGIGDDTAVLRLPGAGYLLFTTDMMVEGIHFSLAYGTLRQVGIKAMAANVSDIAAMGGRPTQAVVSVALPSRLKVADVEDLYRGLREASREYGLNVVGGDTVRNPERLIINVAMLGDVPAGRAVYRSGARPGDLVFVSGTVGKAAAGLQVCRQPEVNWPAGPAAFARRAHLEPGARLELGLALAAGNWATSLNDISDGLASEVHEICRASGVGCRVRRADLPLAPETREIAARAGADALEWALFGGEDFELVGTISPGNLARARQALGVLAGDLCLIGEILPPGEGVFLTGPDGCDTLLNPGGYNHFR